MNLRVLSLAGATLLTIVASAGAQTTTGTIRGYVRDANGTALAGGTIEARQTETGVRRTATSRDDGSYILPGLVPGAYELTVRQIGHGPQRRQVAVQIGATLLVDFTLQAGAVELQAVTVEGAPVIEMRTSEVATNVTAQQIQQLPTVSRNFLDLAALAPGVTVVEERVNGTGFRSFSAGGASPNQSNVFIDGASLKNDLTGGGVAGQDASRGNPFPRNAIQEYRVISQNFKAEYQKASSAIITATTRSGSNTWSGNAFFSHQNKDLVALDTIQRRNPTFEKPDFTRYLAGVSVGGPLIRDRLFFFGSYEGNYQDRSSQVNITPVTGFTGIDTVNLTQYNDNFTSPFRETLLFGKLTYAINENSSAELSFNTRHETDVRDFGGARTYTAAANFRQDVSIGQLRYSRFWGPWLNETKIDYSRFRRNPSPDVPGVPARMYRYRIPSTTDNQTAWVGSSLSEQDFIQERLGFRNDLTYSGMQQHVIKGGASVDLVTYDIGKLNNATPQFDYAQLVDPATHDYNPTTGMPFDFRNPYRLIFATGAGDVNRKNTQIGAYLQDDWTPTPRLTINLGIRWDFESRMINTDYVTPQMVVDTLTFYNDSLPTPLDLNRYISTGNNRDPFYGAFQPRLGFSYALDDDNRTVIFGGAGIYYDRSLFDFSIDEIQKIDRPTYTVRFAHPDTTPVPAGQVRWDDSLLTADTSVLSALARTFGQPEAFLLDNEMKPPRSTQFNLGIRRALGSWIASLAYQGQRGTDLFTYNWANIGLDSAGHTCTTGAPGCPNFDIAAHGFRNFIFSTNDGKTWYDALSLQLDRPYRPSAGGIGWGGGVVYTYAFRYVAGVDELNAFSGSFPGGFPNARSIPKRLDGGGNDERHRLVANWIMEVPQLFGIQFSGLITLGSGGRRDVGTHPRFGGVKDSTYFPAAFTPPQQNLFVLGGWAYRRVDLKFRKDFPEISGTTLGVTVDVYNAFNFANWGGYPTNVPSPNPGRTWSVGQPNAVVSDPRRVQIGVEYTF